MKEENIDQRIERIIQEVASKQTEMSQWSKEYELSQAKERLRRRRRIIYGVSAAASVAIVLGIGISLMMVDRGTPDAGMDMTPGAEMSLGEPTGPVYRGGGNEIAMIETMIDSAKYGEALTAINTTMADTMIDPECTPERREYLKSLNDDRNYELEWVKIDLLIKMGNKEEAVKLLEDYVKVIGVHQDEAKKLLKQLKR
ncbi:MAG: hypothetical protein ACI304_02585 [Lepagella sp.]